MAKCGKGCMPECEYFTTGGCVSPFDCIYKIKQTEISSNTEIALLCAENAEAEREIEEEKNGKA